MKFRGLDLNLLVALDALLVERNVSAAARKTFVSQPAMSAALAKLREHFQDELLAPLGRRMVPTAYGESLAEPVRQLMLQIEATVDVGIGFDPGTSQRKFAILVSDYVAELIMPRVSARVAEQAPNIVLNIIPNDGIPAEMIENGRVDLVVVPEFVASSRHPSEFLIEEEYVVMGWEQNSALHGQMSLDDFFKFGRVTWSVSVTRAHSFAEIQIRQMNPNDRIELFVPSLSTVPKFLIGTQRVSLIHESIAKFYSSILPLKYVPLPVKIDTITMVVQHHAVRAADTGIQWLKSIIREAATSDDGWP